MADDHIWIQNDVHNRTKKRDEQLSRERITADENVRRAKQRLTQAAVEIDKQSTLDRKQLDWKLAQERARIFDGIEGLTHEMRLAIGQQNVRFREQIDALRRSTAQIENRVAQIDSRITQMTREFEREINGIIDKEKDRETRAQMYCTQLQMILGEINLLYPDKLTPGEREIISDNLTSVLTDIEAGDYQVAIGLVQRNLPVALELQSRLEVLYDEYSELVLRIHDRSASVFERINSLKNPTGNKCPLSCNGTSEEFDGRISFWSSGLLDEIEAHFREICCAIEDEYEVEMDIESLREALAELEQIDEQLSGCVEVAHNEYYEFLRVRQLAVSIFESMTRDNCWHIHPDSTGFAGDDERRPYKMVYDDGCGNIASIVVFHNREVRNQTRRGIEYGETQFTLDICDGIVVTDAEHCEITRRGLLSRLEESHIDIGNSNRQDTHISNSNSTDFIADSVIAGDKIKEGRISTARNNMGILRNGG